MAENDNDMLPEAHVFPDPLPAETEALRAEVAALKDRALRALADAENTRKRAEREKSETSQYADRVVRARVVAGRRQSPPRTRCACRPMNAPASTTRREPSSKASKRPSAICRRCSRATA